MKRKSSNAYTRILVWLLLLCCERMLWDVDDGWALLCSMCGVSFVLVPIQACFVDSFVCLLDLTFQSAWFGRQKNASSVPSRSHVPAATTKISFGFGITNRATDRTQHDWIQIPVTNVATMTDDDDVRSKDFRNLERSHYCTPPPPYILDSSTMDVWAITIHQSALTLHVETQKEG